MIVFGIIQRAQMYRRYGTKLPKTMLQNQLRVLTQKKLVDMDNLSAHRNAVARI